MSLPYTDADEDPEHLLSFANASAPSADGNKWVETHGPSSSLSRLCDEPSEIADIPDLDGDGPHEDEERLAQGVGGISLGGGGLGRRRCLIWMISQYGGG